MKMFLSERVADDCEMGNPKHNKTCVVQINRNQSEILKYVNCEAF